MAQAEQLERQQAAAKAPKSGKAVENGGEDDDEEADLAGVDAGDVELVMSQAKCSKAKGECGERRVAIVGGCGG